jgi:hypothetical protein
LYSKQYRVFLDPYKGTWDSQSRRETSRKSVG